MWLHTIRLENIKSFEESGTIQFSKGINILVGPNNSGKSTLLKGIQLLQPFQSETDYLKKFFADSLRSGANEGKIYIVLREQNPKQLVAQNQNTLVLGDFSCQFVGGQTLQSALIVYPTGSTTGIGNGTTFCKRQEPDNFIYPYFSRRKPSQFTEQINIHSANIIEEGHQNLPSKIDRLTNSESQHYQTFKKICNDIFGFTISSAAWKNGKQPGLTLADDSFLPLEAMGEGTINVLTLLGHLASASGKLFIMEEIENDLHPKALKTLLDFIIKKSETNQFIISTHNNIVARHLGGTPNTKMFSVEMSLNQRTKTPTSTCNEVSDLPEERIKLLENLGYEPADFYLWKGYLILEESTAERIIREFIIPYFAPKLQGALKTIAASGVNDVDARLSDLLRVFVFVHSAPQYRERAWIAVDGGNAGEKVILDLKNKFTGWPEDHFISFSLENFEYYYPANFQTKVSSVLALPKGLEKQRAKGDLAVQVLNWAISNQEEASRLLKNAFILVKPLNWGVV